MKPTIIKACLLAAMLMTAGSKMTVLAQSSEPFNPYAEFKPSAETWSMGRYGGTKPSLYTGAMTYSIPLFTYNDPDFTIPVSLEYGFDGYRPTQHSGTVGYGWHLECGGVITRDVRGLPDDDVIYGPADRGLAGYLHTVNNGYGYVSDTLGNNVRWSIYCNTICTPYPTREMAIGINPFTHIPLYVKTIWVDGVPKPASSTSYDLTPDIYSFVIPGHHGNFMLQPDGSVRVFNSDLPYGEVSVEIDGQAYCRRGNDPEICSFTIRTGDGTRYIFGGDIRAIEYAASQSTGPTLNIPACSATAFRLVKIKAPNGREVEFKYSSAKQVSISGSRSYTLKWSGGNYTKASEQVYNKSYCYFSVPESVTVDEKNVLEFSYASKSQDENDSGYFTDQLPAAIPDVFSGIPLSASAMRLSGFTARNIDGELVEKAELTQQYAPSGTPKMFLESVRTRRNGRHTFHYNLSKSLPKNDQLETDHWGFWNGSPLSDIRSHLQFSGSRYSQFTSAGVKAPNWQFASTGALTEIEYPTGGYTDIEYEGNFAISALDEEGQIYLPSAGTMPVGGVRVSRTTDFTNDNDKGYGMEYDYSGGFLYQMPRYLFEFPFSYTNATTGSLSGVSLYATLTAYNAESDYSVSRDEAVGYREIILTHPDGSSTKYEFSCWDDSFKDEFVDEYNAFPYHYIPKCGVLGNYDYIGEQIISGTAPYYARPYIDRRNMRGRLLAETHRDAAGNPVKGTNYSYTSEKVSLKQIWWNDLEQFICSPWTCESPMLQKTEQTDYGDDGASLKFTTEYSYNAFGQITGTHSWSSSDPDSGWSTYHQYLHESQNVLRYGALPGAPYITVWTRTEDGRQYLLGSEISVYTSIPSVSILPFMVEQHCFETPTVVTGAEHAIALAGFGRTRFTSLTYNNLLRPNVVTLPGGRVLSYLWNGNNIVRRTAGLSESTMFGWKDQVGLTSVTDPSGHIGTYEYDSRGRLSTVKDTAGNTVERYDYKLENE